VIIFGSSLFKREDAASLLSMLTTIDSNLSQINGKDKSCLNVIQPTASQYGASQLGLDSADTGNHLNKAKFVYCVGVDEEGLEKVFNGNDKFVIFQGHHGNELVAQADVILPGAAYTEKDSLFFNTEGRPQCTRRALTPPGHAREDWRIIEALGEFLGKMSSHVSRSELLASIAKRVPSIKSIGKVPANTSLQNTFSILSTFSISPMSSSIENFYMTDPISKASSTMAKCTELLVGDDKLFV
jgi:NADH-quinone oxidoreductase subunit G